MKPRRSPLASVPVLAAAAVFVVGLARWAPAEDGAERPDARPLVERGIAHLAAGDVAAAQEAFSSARAAAPDDPIVAFDLGCAHLAAGKLDEAAAAFDAALVEPDAELALAVARNRALVAARRAEAEAGPEPQQAKGDARERITSSVAEAVRHLRTVLAARPDDPAAVADLATLKTWLIALQDAWRLADEAEAKQEPSKEEEPGALEILARLRDASRALGDSLAAPGADLAAATQATATTVRPELKALDETLAREFEAMATQGASQEEVAAAKTQIEAATGELERITTEIDGALAAQEAARASQAAGALADAADALWLALAGFEPLVGRALEEQSAIVAAATDAKVEDQRATHEVTRTMIERAAAEAAAGPAPGNPASPPPAAGAPPAADPRAEALALAAELGPQALGHQENAATLLDVGKALPAMEEAEKARELLERIAKALPKDPNQQRSKGDSNQEQDDQEQKQEQEQEQESGQDDADASKPNEPSGEPKPAADHKEGTEDSQELRSLLQRVREREAEHREKVRRMRLLGRVPVEKDW